MWSGPSADTRGFKKPLFLSCILVGCAGCLLMGLTTWWISFLVIFIIAKVGFHSSLVFYDSMLSDVTAPERMDRVSSSGYAWGYAGSCIPFVVSLVFVLGYQKDFLLFPYTAQRFYDTSNAFPHGMRFPLYIMNLAILFH